MKLLSHNMLTSRCLRGVAEGYPLGIVATDVRVSSVEFNAEFVSKMIPRLDYKVLWQAANTLGYSEGLPPNEPVENYDNNEDFLKKLHHVLLEVDVITGELICPETGRKFPITKGIPNMLLTEAEV